VYMQLPGMQGTSAQLQFEFAQDQLATCSEVRPGHQCGVTVDNVVVRSVASILPFAVDLQVRPSLTRDSSTGEIIAQIALQNAGPGPASNVQLTSVLLNGLAASSALPNLGDIEQGASATTTVRFPAAAGTPGEAGLLAVSGTYNSGDLSTSTRVVLP